MGENGEVRISVNSSSSSDEAVEALRVQEVRLVDSVLKSSILNEIILSSDSNLVLDVSKVGSVRSSQIVSLDVERVEIVLFLRSVRDLVELVKLALENDKVSRFRFVEVENIRLKLFKSISNLKEVLLLEEKVKVFSSRLLQNGFYREKESILLEVLLHVLSGEILDFVERLLYLSDSLDMRGKVSLGDVA